MMIGAPKVFAYCGNGLLESAQGEQCDDGNFLERDGCNAYCRLEDMDPPQLVSSDPAKDAINISPSAAFFTITFSEALKPSSVNLNNIQIKEAGDALPIDLKMTNQEQTIQISLKEPLTGEKKHSIYLKGIQDTLGNVLEEPIIILFTTGVYIDKEPPVVVINPESGEYNVPQSIHMTAYLNERTSKELDNEDKNAKIYYTLDERVPTQKSEQYKNPFTLREKTTLKYFAEDDKGNRSRILTAHYTFACPAFENTKKVSPYPDCEVKECNYGFTLLGNACVARLDAKSGGDDIHQGAVTAPLFPSSQPLTISTKPAIRFTEAHQGEVKRPLIFNDIKRGTQVYFDAGTKITDADEIAFIGYIQPPQNLYSKNFPIQFGYTFKSIFSFYGAGQEELFFDPSYSITIPFSDVFKPGEEVFVFTLDKTTGLYEKIPEESLVVDHENHQVQIISGKSDTFFVAQQATGYNQAHFEDTVGHWAQNYVERLYREGMVRGKQKNLYAPDDFLTRAEFIKICLSAIEVKVSPEEEIDDAPFIDVPLTAWYSNYIDKAKELKLISGYPDGRFRPEQPINRAEAIKILISAFGFKLPEIDEIAAEKYPNDVYLNTWYYPFINFVVKNDLLGSIRDGRNYIPGSIFGPERYITRAEMAELTIKTIDLKAKTPVKKESRK